MDPRADGVSELRVLTQAASFIVTMEVHSAEWFVDVGNSARDSCHFHSAVTLHAEHTCPRSFSNLSKPDTESLSLTINPNPKTTAAGKSKIYVWL